MASREQLIQRLTPIYQEETGKTEMDSMEFAEWLMRKGMEPPPAPTPLELLAKQARRAWKQDIRKDVETGKPYHKYHALPVSIGPGGQIRFFYFDIERATRKSMEKSAKVRVEQMIDDGVRIAYDVDHWNRINPGQEQIEIDFNLTDPIAWRKAAPDEDEKAA